MKKTGDKKPVLFVVELPKRFNVFGLFLSMEGRWYKCVMHMVFLSIFNINDDFQYTLEHTGFAFHHKKTF